MPTAATTDPGRPSADALVLDADGVRAYLGEAWPEAQQHYETGLIELRPGFCRFTRPATAADRRPGDTLQGPLMMEAVDQAGYALVLGHLGDAALAVTSHLSIEFLRRPHLGSLIVDTRLRKLGRTQVTMTCELHVDEVDADRPVAIATVVYSRALVR